jgi:predicted nucleic acid-binding protein
MKEELASNAYGALVTSDYVLDETLALLRTRRGIKAALDFVSKVRRSKSLQIVWI